jgi:hypothetical protein
MESLGFVSHDAVQRSKSVIKVSTNRAPPFRRFSGYCTGSPKGGKREKEMQKRGGLKETSRSPH